MQWSKLYGSGTPSQKLIAEMMETYTLVNVVHNDFRAPEAIFAPFYRAAQATPPLTNGVPNGQKAINGTAKSSLLTNGLFTTGLLTNNGLLTNGLTGGYY